MQHRKITASVTAPKLQPVELAGAADLADADEMPAANGAYTVRPAAQRARFRWRHAVIIFTFLAMVVAPVVWLGQYLFTIAAPQYASSMAFNVRSDEAAAPAASVLGFQFDSATETDAEILNAFIASQPLVETIDAALDIRTHYARPVEDWVFRFHPSGSIEDLLTYWNRMVAVSLKADKGLIEVEVRAFDPDEARDIARAILIESERMINRLSQEAEEDATRFARDELERAEDRLRAARQALTMYRSENQIIDPEAVVAAQMGLLTSLQRQLADALVEYDLLGDVAASSDPRLQLAERQTQSRIEVIENRISEEKAKLASVSETPAGNVRPVTELVGRFEELRVDLQFAERSYLAARTAFDAALEKARRNSRYLATYKPPTLAQTAQYPEAFTILGIVALFLFLIWSVFALVLYSIRDRR